MINNNGSASLEATIIVPLFIFVVLAVYHMGESRLCQEVLYEAAIETGEYVAEYAYVADEDMPFYSIAANRVFEQYIDREELLEKYIQGGVSGVFISVIGPDEDNYIELKVSYRVKVEVPLLGSYADDKGFTIRQKAYLGYTEPTQEADEVQTELTYVYITDNKEAYHTTRDCTHLKLSVMPAGKSLAIKGGYTPCEFCYEGEASVYVTEWGNRYHSSQECSGLKRTVYRVEKKSVSDIPPCNRCGYE